MGTTEQTTKTNYLKKNMKGEVPKQYELGILRITKF